MAIVFNLPRVSAHVCFPRKCLSELNRSVFFCMLVTEQQESDSGMAKMVVRHTGAVHCDSCGSASVKSDEERATLTVDDVVLAAGLRWCVDCRQNLCSNCVVIHSRLTASRSHCVVPLPLRGREFEGSTCPVHSDQTTDLFCGHCRQLVCTSCSTSPEHEDHSCDDVVSSAARLRSLLLSDAASVDDRRRRCDRLEADVTADKHIWLSSVQAADVEIKAAAAKLRALVDRHCASLSDELISTKQLRLKELQGRLEDLAQERSRLDSLSKKIHDVVDASADVQLLVDAGNLHDSVERCLVELTAVTSRDFFTSGQTVMFVPSAGRTSSSDDADSLLGRVQVVGGEVSRHGQTAEEHHIRPSSMISEGTSRVRGQQRIQQAPALYYRQLLTTLNEGHLPVCGLAVVADRLYVCRSQSADIDVYDAGRTTYRRQISIHVPGLTEPSDMTGTSGDVSRLFISSESGGLVFRVTLMATSSGDVVHTRWSTDDRPYGVSVMQLKHLLVLSRESASVSVLDDDGRQLRRLRLPASVFSPWSAVHISTSAGDAAGDLVVCHGDSTLDVDGRQRRGVSRLGWSTGVVTRRYDWIEQPAGTRRRSSVMHMVPESDAHVVGGLLLADECCDRVERVGSGLTSHEALLQTSADDGDDSVVEQPRRLCVDSTRQRLVVGLHDGRVKVFANGCIVM